MTAKPDQNQAHRSDSEGDPATDPVVLPITDSLDLHTIHPRDLSDVVAEYLWEAGAKGFTEVRIIHGKGIGVQRRMVVAALERHEAVASYVSASSDRGHYGATIVRLRSGVQR
jgi:DNA-nicking Smr family endonuclease